MIGWLVSWIVTVAFVVAGILGVAHLIDLLVRRLLRWRAERRRRRRRELLGLHVVSRDCDGEAG